MYTYVYRGVYRLNSKCVYTITAAAAAAAAASHWKVGHVMPVPGPVFGLKCFLDWVHVCKQKVHVYIGLHNWIYIEDIYVNEILVKTINTGMYRIAIFELGLPCTQLPFDQLVYYINMWTYSTYNTQSAQCNELNDLDNELHKLDNYNVLQNQEIKIRHTTLIKISG